MARQRSGMVSGMDCSTGRGDDGKVGSNIWVLVRCLAAAGGGRGGQQRRRQLGESVFLWLASGGYGFAVAAILRRPTSGTFERRGVNQFLQIEYHLVWVKLKTIASSAILDL